MREIPTRLKTVVGDVSNTCKVELGVDEKKVIHEMILVIKR